MSNNETQNSEHKAGALDRPFRRNPLRTADGELHDFILRIAGRRLVCKCNCSVFHRPILDVMNLYECNNCGRQFEVAS